MKQKRNIYRRDKINGPDQTKYYNRQKHPHDVHTAETWCKSVSGEFPAQRPVTRSFDIFFDLRLNKRLTIHS